MKHRRAPRALGEALGPLQERWAPPSVLAAVQRAWPEVVGELVAREAHPAAERGGTVTVTCSSSLWAHELDLMAPAILERLDEALGGPRVTRLRCQAAPPR